MTVPNNINYYGFTHIPFPQFLLPLWKRFCCKRGIHLLDEVIGTGGPPETNGWNHYLVCSACQLVINISSIDQTHVKDKIIGYYD